MANKSGGLASGCLWLFGGLIVLSVAIYAIAIALFVAIGVGLWFGIRYIWRRLVIEAPNSKIVKMGMKLPPIGRKVSAGIASALVVFVLMGLFGQTTSTNTQVEQPAPSSNSAIEQPTNQNETGKDSALGDLTIRYLDVAQGDSALVELPDGKTMLVDAGEASASQIVLDALAAAKVDRIDYLVASHPHADHIGGMEAVLETIEVGEVWAPDAPDATDTYTGFLDAVENKGLSIDKAVAGAEIVNSSEGYEVSILGPQDGVNSSDMNDYSSIIKVEYGDTSFLFTGDASADDIVDAKPGHVDVLKAAHHGSETGTDTATLEETTPEYIVISYAEGNSYGHPDQSVLDAISDTTAKTYSTAANGTITAVSDGKEIAISVEREGKIAAGQTADERTAVEAQEQTAAQQQAQQAQQAQQQEKTVVVTSSGSKYHSPGCRTLNRSKSLTEMTVSQAKAQGYEPCGVCAP